MLLRGARVAAGATVQGRLGMSTVAKGYEEAVRTLYGLQSNAAVISAWKQERRSNLKVDLRPEMLYHCSLLGVDFSRLPLVHITGTKGKGSTAAMTESILRSHGLRTGLFVSPHLIEPTERIRLDGRPLSKELFTHYFWLCYNTLQASPSEEFPKLPPYFRFLTLMGFKVFQEERIEAGVVEVGIGGRTDATNVLLPHCCGVSSIGLDHQTVLGDTLGQIAWEKSGIFKEGAPAFSVPQKEEPAAMLASRAAELGAPYGVVPPLEAYEAETGENVELGLAGAHQRENAALAIGLANAFLTKRAGGSVAGLWEPFKLTDGYLRGLREAHWAGRSHRLDVKHRGLDAPLLHCVDGAHTEDSLRASARWFLSEVEKERQQGVELELMLVFNCSHGRDEGRLLSALAGELEAADVCLSAALFCNFDTTLHPVPEKQEIAEQERNASKWREVAGQRAGETSVHPSIPHALEAAAARQEGGRRQAALVTGSLYLAGGWLECLRELHGAEVRI